MAVFLVARKIQEREREKRRTRAKGFAALNERVTLASYLTGVRYGNALCVCFQIDH